MRIVLEFRGWNVKGLNKIKRGFCNLLERKSIKRAFLISCVIILTGCSAWQEDFEQKPVRGMPKASIHEISTKVDRGEIREEDTGSVRTIGLNSGTLGNTGAYFSDGRVSRGYEEVHRIYITEYEDKNGNLHGGHNLYIVVRPAGWTFHKGE